MVLDPAQRGGDARVARWDLDKEVAAKLLRSDPLDRGLHFRPPGPTGRPTTNACTCSCAYCVADGRSLEAEQPITVKLPSVPAQAWTPRQDRPGVANVTAIPPEGHGSLASGAPPNPIAPSSSVREPAANPPPTAERQLTNRPGRFWKPQR